MKKNASRGALLWASTILSLAAPEVAMAQATSNEDEITVTARRREESQQEVPVAVSVLNGAKLAEMGVTDINSLQGKVPNLVIVAGQGSGGSTPVFAIRGLSQQDLTHLSDPSVSLYVNDIVVPRPIGANLAFFDIASVQVLRGPQGTLFGRNTPGGAIVVTPNAPTETFEASVSQTLANFGTYQTEAMVNLPLGDAASFRIAALHGQSDGYIFDVNTGDEINFVNENGVRATLDLHPSDKWNSRFTASYADSNSGGTGAYARVGSIGGAAQASRDIYHTASGVPQFSDVQVFGLENHTTFDLSNAISIRNIVGYRKLENNTLEDVDGNASFVLPIQRFVEQDQVSEEFQVLGDHSWGNWIAGAFYFKETGDEQGVSAGSFAGGGVDAGAIEPITDLRRYPIYSNTWSTAENISTAVFAQATFKLDSVADGLSLTAGVRQNWDERNAVIKNQTRTACRFSTDGDRNPATPETNPGLAGCALPLSANFQEPTYNLSLDWKVTDDALLYVATRHGYRTGGFGARATTQQGLSRTFEPETVNDVEVGLKADWRINDMFLRTNVALFQAKYTDIQRLLSDPNTTPPTTVTTNAGKADINGYELEFVFRPMNWLEFSGFAAYTDADFTQFIAPNGQDLSTAPFARAPRNIRSLSARVDLPSNPEVGDASLGLNFFHQDAYSSNDSFIPGVTVAEGYDLVNFNADLKNALGGKADVSFFVKNMFENEYSTPVINLGFATLNSAVAGEPRTYGVRLSYHFGDN